MLRASPDGGGLSGVLPWLRRSEAASGASGRNGLMPRYPITEALLDLAAARVEEVRCLVRAGKRIEAENQAWAVGDVLRNEFSPTLNGESGLDTEPERAHTASRA